MSSVTQLMDRFKAWAIRGIGGLIALASSLFLIWQINAGRIDARMFSELRGKTHSVDVARVDPANEGTIVHLSAASLSSALGVKDSAFSIASPGFALRREVAMFQWFEKKHGRGLRARYEYFQDWCYCWNDAGKFHDPAGHENARPAFKNEIVLAPDAKLGAFALTDLTLAKKAFDEYDEAEPPYPPNALVRLASDVSPLPSPSAALQAAGWKLLDGGAAYYLGKGNESDPVLGDQVVSFSQLEGTVPVSMIGVQRQGAIEAYQRTPRKAYLLAVTGEQDSARMIADAKGRSHAAVGLLRAVALIGLTLGLGIFAPALQGLTLRVPILGALAKHSAFGAGAVVGLLLGGIFWGIAML